VLALEVVDFAKADAVLAGTRSASSERVLDDRRVDLLRDSDLVLALHVDQERDIVVAVPDVPEDRRRNAQTGADPGLVGNEVEEPVCADRSPAAVRASAPEPTA
jgi:hypothetical protein